MDWSPGQELVTLDELKDHLKLPLDSAEEDNDLRLKLFIAHELVMDYVSQRLDGQDDWQAEMLTWDLDTVPKRVKAAILYQAAEMYRFRGDEDRSNRVAGELSADVVTLLYRLRDPAVS